MAQAARSGTLPAGAPVDHGAARRAGLRARARRYRASDPLNVAVIPAPGSGLASMRATGQLERLYTHLAHYANRFHLTYVTWGNYHDEARLWQPFAEQTGARL